MSRHASYNYPTIVRYRVCYNPIIMRAEVGGQLSLRDRLTAAFATPYSFVSFDNIRQMAGSDQSLLSKKQITNNVFEVRRRTGKDIEAVLHVGGWCWVPENADTQFDLINFRNPPAEIAILLDGQREAFEQIWPHVRTVERRAYQWRGRTFYVLNPLVPVWVHDTLCTMITVLSEKNRGLIWQDVYPYYIGNKRGKDCLSVTASTLNNFCGSRSIPFRLTSARRRSEYLFVRQ